MQSVLDFAQTAGSTAFDRERPLWELTVLDGLFGGRAAIVLKVHHALTDGVGGMAITREIVDLTRAGERPLATPPVQREPTNGAVPSWYRLSAAALSRQIIARAPERARWVAGHPYGTARAVAASLVSVARFVRPIATTLSPVMTARSIRRRFAVLEVPIEDLSQAASSGGGSINDAFIAAVLLAMRHYHRRHGAAIDKLRVTIPMSLRTERDPLEGNKITLARLTLPADTDDPAVLIRQVHAIINRWRSEPAIALSPAIAGVLNVLPPTAAREDAQARRHRRIGRGRLSGTAVHRGIPGRSLLRVQPDTRRGLQRDDGVLRISMLRGPRRRRRRGARYRCATGVDGRGIPKGPGTTRASRPRACGGPAR